MLASKASKSTLALKASDMGSNPLLGNDFLSTVPVLHVCVVGPQSYRIASLISICEIGFFSEPTVSLRDLRDHGSTSTSTSWKSVDHFTQEKIPW
jgi:hypothetical protein